MAARSSSATFYVDRLMQEWRVGEHSRRIQTCLRRVLCELCDEAVLALKNELRLEVQIRPDADHSVWAYFPMHSRLRSSNVRVPQPGTMDELATAMRAATNDLYRRQLAAKKFKPKPATEVLLVLNAATREKQDLFRNQLRDHLGHTLLYLRNPKARNECKDAEKEWRASVKALRPARRRAPGEG